MAPANSDFEGNSPVHSSTSNHTDPKSTEPPKAKQRKLNRTLPQLKRNAACLPCRRRRIKCDAGKPHCSSCVRSYHFLARTQPDVERDAKGVQCFYDEDAEDIDDDLSHMGQTHDRYPKQASSSSPLDLHKGTKRKGNSAEEDPKDIIKKLEDKVAELQQALSASSAFNRSSGIDYTSAPAEQSLRPQQVETSSWAGPTPNTFPGDFLSAPYNPPNITTTPFDLSTNIPFSASQNSLPTTAAQTEQPARRSTQVTDVNDIDAEAGRFSGPFLDILFPGWPPKLPTPSMLEHLVETFFNMVPSVPRVIHRQTFLARLALPPTHSDYPHVSLLHAICAAAARYTAAVKCRPVRDAVDKTNLDAKRANGKGLPYDDPVDETCFSERNARYAMAALKFEHVSGRGLFDMLQCMIVLCHWGQSSAKWIEGWVMIGGAGRLAICLGLLDHRPDHFGMPALRQSMLGPPKTDAEREERRAVMYYIVANDCISAASSGWPNTLPVNEMTTRMPCHRTDFEKLDKMPENPQYYHSPDLFTSHPVADGFNMMMKADRLLARQMPEFKKIDMDIAAFNLNFPPSLRDPIQYLQGHAKGVDADLIAAHLIPRIASIFLHEPFADISDVSCPSAQRLLMEARAVLNIVYLVVSSNADISYMVMPICSFYFFTACRTLLLFYQRALETGDQGAAYVFRSEIVVFKMAFGALANRFAMGARHLIMVEMVMSHIEEEALGHPLPPEGDMGRVPKLPGQPPAWQIAHPEMRRAYDSAVYAAATPSALQHVVQAELPAQLGSHLGSGSPAGESGSNGQSPNGSMIWVNWQSIASHTTEGQLPPELRDNNLRTQAQQLDPKFSIL
ncbi:uncharacterized protein I206_106658 [Kwoniella pini CBS 10737]|uniref:Zn(2)-C6 fungal-type domain-containing protein n=1 Tax=Kwoniella pini CBS 10737 TaxID=1296096 RepID=A0AAJ8MSW2_9TREE